MATATTSNLQHHVDSVVSAEVRSEMERLRETGLESSTDLVIYDTERADSMGNSPVKAVLTQRTRRSERSQERGTQTQSATESKQSESMEDSTAKSETTKEEARPRRSVATIVLWSVTVTATLMAAGYIVYKRKKKKRKSDMENEETTQTAKVETAAAASSAKKSAKKKQVAQSGETALQKVGKAAIARHGFSAVYVTSDGLAFAQECDAKSHASDLTNKDILKVTKQ